MMHSANERESGNELKFSREQGFFDKSFGIRVLIGLTFALALFLILHFREVRVESFELNSLAPRYVVAQVDLDFTDDEATIIHKQEAVRDVGKIFQVSEREIQQRRQEFENHLLTEPSWREKVIGAGLEEMYNGVDALEKSLSSIRFANRTTLKEMKAVDFPHAHYHVYMPKELEAPLPAKIWEDVAKSIPGDERVKAYLIEYFKGKPWTLEEDIPSQRALRRSIQSLVPDKQTHLSAGSRVIDQGEKVTARHMAIMQAMKDKMGDKRNLWHPETLLGSFLMTLVLAAVCVTYFQINYPKILFSNRKLSLIVAIILITFGMAKGTEYFLLASKTNLIEVVRYPLFVPFAAILLCSLMNAQIATFISGFLSIILGISLAFDMSGFILMNLAASLAAILSARSLRQRKEVFVICGKAWLCTVLIVLAIHLYQNTLGKGLTTDLAVTGSFMLLTAVLVVGLLPLLESAFRIMTDVTLMEYMDPNHELLRRLSIEAPGTYQHSVVVGNLAEAAALAIGANGLFCRVSSLFHDIGKMSTPQYFTENQQGEMNIHQLLTPKESAQVIINHVSEGVAMGRKAGLPEQFIDVIKEHHGTTLVYYFYRKQQELIEENGPPADPKDFRYFGPRPRTKESAIIMIADSLEAASRSLDQFDEETVSRLTESIIRSKAKDGQFDHCLITFEEMAIVKNTLVKTLCAFSHSRVKYPKSEEAVEQALVEAGR